MNDKRYRWILYTIATVIIATIGIQAYWNYKNYQTNKQQLINDVQTSLDKAVDDYYANLAEETTIGMSFKGTNTDELFKEGSSFTNILKDIDKQKGKFKNLDSIDVSHIEGATIVRGFKVDSMMTEYSKKNKPISVDSLKTKTQELKDESALSNIEMLTSKIVISINNDTLDLKKVDSLVNFELLRKNINVDYNLKYTPNKHTFNQIEKKHTRTHDSLNTSKKLTLNTFSKSTFLPKGSKLSIAFTNETKVILTRIFGGILISVFLVLAVISCLFYLLKIIKHQKQLAEVKNDLISNITHEFKTPIATIGVALESISNFNAIEDKEKTKKYVAMSSQQLKKLNIMVEKLLETATLDSDSLQLNKEPTDIVELINTLLNRYKIQFPEKEFKPSFKVEHLITNVDVFHFENALNNILDNAVKYGGSTITIGLISRENQFEIFISDNGTSLNKENKDRVFEKFYRVPKGNTHNVKGFGIGLYYTKTIIDKHNGSITLDLNKNLTTFKITLPNG